MKTCAAPLCDTRFKPRRSDARYCSPACRQDAYRARSRTDNPAPVGHRSTQQKNGHHPPAGIDVTAKETWRDKLEPGDWVRVSVAGWAFESQVVAVEPNNPHMGWSVRINPPPACTYQRVRANEIRKAHKKRRATTYSTGLNVRAVDTNEIVRKER